MSFADLWLLSLALCFLVPVALALYLGPRGTEMLLRPGQRWVRVPVSALTPELQRYFRGQAYISADANRLVQTPRGITGC